MSVVEAFTAEQLAVRAEAAAPAPRSPILEDIYINAEDRAIGSWPAMKTAYKKWLGVSIEKAPEWKRVQAMVDARNAVAHGLGVLTRRQARRNSADLARSFAQIGITVVGARLHVSDATLRTAARAGKHYIEWLDSKLLSP